jgi:hypothetical protein
MFRPVRVLTLAFGLCAVWPAVGRSQTLTPGAPGGPPTPGQVSRLFGGPDPVPEPPSTTIQAPSNPGAITRNYPGGGLLGPPKGPHPNTHYISPQYLRELREMMRQLNLTPDQFVERFPPEQRPWLRRLLTGEEVVHKQVPQTGPGTQYPWARQQPPTQQPRTQHLPPTQQQHMQSLPPTQQTGGQFRIPHQNSQIPGGQMAQHPGQGQQLGGQSQGGQHAQGLQFGGQSQGGQMVQHQGQGQQFGGQSQGGQSAQGQQSGGQ